MFLKSETAWRVQQFPVWEALGILVLLWPAFWNGYPLLNADAGTNLLSGIKLETPVDRPIGYGILLRIFSLNSFSLWVAVAFQVALVTFLFFQTCRQVLPAVSRFKIFGLLCVLCATTSLPWVATLIIPDIYTALAFLLLFLILTRPRPSPWLYVLFFVSTATHASQVQIMMGMLLSLTLLRPLLFKALPKKVFWGRAGILALLSGLTVLTMLSAISKSKHVFFIASMQNRGILKPFLDKACLTSPLAMCNVKEEFAGKSGDWFLWDPTSPLYRNGADWRSHREEYNEVISASFQDSEYRWLQLKTILQAGLRQITDYRFINYDRSHYAGESVYDAIVTYFPVEREAMIHAGQQTGAIKPTGDFFNVVQSIMIPLSIGILLFAFVAGPLRRNRRVLAFTVASVLLILGNDLVCAGFSGVNSRYGARVIWLLPMCAGLVALDWKRKPMPAGTEPDRKP